MSATQVGSLHSGATDVARPRLVYLLAASHSGSTLTAMLLGTHPDICTAGELKLTSLGDIRNYRCSCRQLITECDFWNGIKEDMQRRGFDFQIGDAGTDIHSGASPMTQRLLKPLHRGPWMERVRDCALAMCPSWRKSLPQIQARNTALVQSIAALTRNNIIVDSSKIGIRLKYLLRWKEIDVRVIRIVRDGRAVALTYMDPASFADATDPSLREGGMGGNRESERLSMEAAAHEWLRSNEEAESIQARMDREQWMQIRYEDLCARPDEILADMFRFVGADTGRPVTRFRSRPLHVVGNGMRLDDTAEIRLDDRWARVLKPEHLEVFDRIAGRMNRRLGYS